MRNVQQVAVMSMCARAGANHATVIAVGLRVDVQAAAIASVLRR